jgi:PiT family inorganic phosphate transporter
VIGKVAAFIFLAPIIGMILAYTLTVIIIHICKYAIPSKAEWWFRKLQLVSSAAFSIGHGGNDAQKVMGIIAAAIVVYTSSAAADMSQVPTWLHINTHLVNGKKVFELPNWIPLACYSAIALGTMSGGWKIVKTMGSKITKVTPLEGVAAETAGAITLFMTEHFKIPVSTTHTITGSIIGVGLSKRVSAVRWGVTVNLLWAWILTIPVSAALAALIYFVISVFIK